MKKIAKIGLSALALAGIAAATTAAVTTPAEARVAVGIGIGVPGYYGGYYGPPYGYCDPYYGCPYYGPAYYGGYYGPSLYFGGGGWGGRVGRRRLPWRSRLGLAVAASMAAADSRWRPSLRPDTVNTETASRFSRGRFLLCALV